MAAEVPHWADAEVAKLLTTLGLRAEIGSRELRERIHEELSVRPTDAPNQVTFTYLDDEDEEVSSALLSYQDGAQKWVSPTVPWLWCSPERRLWLRLAWLRGELSWKLTPSQLDVYRKYTEWRKHPDPMISGRIFALDIARRWGKSAELLVIAFEDCIRAPFAWREVYAAPEWEQVRRYIFPIASALLADCPPDLLPVWAKADKRWSFAGNGSYVDVIGLDVNPDGARGGAVDGVKLDEGAFFDNLEELWLGVLFPQMLGRPWARCAAASTPPVTPGHYWSTDVVPDCRNRGGYDRKTLDDADQYTSAEKEEFWAALGGRTAVRARREYGAEHIADMTLAIVPEWTDSKDLCIQVIEPPRYRDCYTVMDPGFSDMAGCLFGYWHFDRAKLVIEDEFCKARQRSELVALYISETEQALWKNLVHRANNGQLAPQPYKRFSDHDPRLLYELAYEYDLIFLPTLKDHLLQQVDAVRVAVTHGNILVHPRCKKLIAQLENGVWKKAPGTKTAAGVRIQPTFARQGGEFGHFDLVACLIYMWRMVEKSRNPVPDNVRMIAGHLVDHRGDQSGRWSGKQHKWSDRSGTAADGRVKWTAKNQEIWIKTGKR